MARIVHPIPQKTALILLLHFSESNPLTSLRFTSLHFTSPHLTSPHLTSPHLTHLSLFLSLSLSFSLPFTSGEDAPHIVLVAMFNVSHCEVRPGGGASDT